MQGEDPLLVHGEKRRQAYKKQRSQTLAFLPVLPLHLSRTDTATSAGVRVSSVGDDCSSASSSVSSAASSSSVSFGRQAAQWLINAGGGGGGVGVGGGAGSGGRGRSVLLASRASIPGGVPQETTRRSLSGGNVSEMDNAHRTTPLQSTRGGGGGPGGGGCGHSHHHQQQHDPSETRRHGSSSSSSGTRTLSGSGPSAAGASAAGGAQQTKRLGRTPSSPSVLLSKVKERIREKVFETSAEWPHMAAIVQERRQRAADAFEARMSLRRMRIASGEEDLAAAEDGGLPQQPLPQQSRTRRVRIRSDPAAHHRRTSSSGSSCSSSNYGGGWAAGGSSSFDKDGARVAFRRRSISDDTYSRGGGGHLLQQQRTARRRMGRGNSSSEGDRGGIVCSDDDLRAIVYEHRLRRSPVPLKQQQHDTMGGEGGRGGGGGGGGEGGRGVTDLCDEAATGDSTVFTDSLANIPSGASGGAPGCGGAPCGGGGGATSAPSVCSARERSSPMSGDKRRRSSSQDVIVSVRSCRDTTAGPTPPHSLPAPLLRDDRSPQENDKDPAGEMEQQQPKGDGEAEEQKEEVGGTDEEEDEEDRSAVVPDVVFDEHGQTWDVYGAEFDPEILGQAIQSHLEKIMKRRLSEKGSCSPEGNPDSADLESPAEIYAKDIVYASTDGHAEANDRALGFFLRYLCFLARSRQNAPQNS